jgi:hypothetical protein
MPTQSHRLPSIIPPSSHAVRRWTRVSDPDEAGGDRLPFIKWSEVDAEFELVGVYRGTQPGEFGDFGVIDRESDGRRQPFNLPAVLAKRLGAVEAGTTVRIVYLGKKPTQDGQRSFHDFDVYTAGPGGAASSDDDEEVPF